MAKPVIEAPARQICTVEVQLVEDIAGNTEILVNGEVMTLLDLNNKPLPQPLSMPLMPGQMAYVISQGLELIACKIVEREQAASTTRRVIEA